MDPILRKNFSYLFILQNLNYVIPLLLLPYLTHILGVGNFGKIAFVQAFANYFILLTDFGFNTSSTQKIVEVRDDKIALSQVFWSTTFAKMLFALGSFIFLAIFLLTVQKSHENYLLLLVAFSCVISTVLTPTWLFQGLEKFSHITFVNLIQKLLVLAITFHFVKQSSDYLLALIIQTGGTFLTAAGFIFLIIKKKIITYYLPDFKEIKSAISHSWHIFVSGMATNIYSTTNTVVLGLLANDAAVGAYSASEKIVRSLISLISSVSQVTFPRINSYFRESKNKALNFGLYVLIIIGIATFIIGLLLMILAPFIVRILFGLPQFNSTIAVLRINSFLPFLSICNGLIAINFLITFGLKRMLMKVVTLGGISSLILIVPAVLLYQEIGVAFVALITEFQIMIMLLYILRRYIINTK